MTATNQSKTRRRLPARWWIFTILTWCLIAAGIAVDGGNTRQLSDLLLGLALVVLIIGEGVDRAGSR